jgi:tRNA nucleotidyltransferase (CCA-adding enzyme)
MLGIYEDTGALSYSTTTPRDLRAAAWLLERGANLLVVNKYPQSSPDGRAARALPELADSAQPYQFHGHSVIIASAQRRRLVERDFDAGAQAV